MKKLKFGSFPLVSIRPEDRECIDSYCIKNYADLITYNTQLKSVNRSVKRYITPETIRKYFKQDRQKIQFDDNIKSKTYDMKRAFFLLQKFSRGIKNNPFYKNTITFPIYVEQEIENNNKVNYNYDFLVLSNDLQKSQILDEIHYDDKITLIFLYLMLTLFPDDDINEIGQSGQGHEIRVAIAKFIEFSRKTNTDPISVMVKLIKLAGENRKRDIMKKNNTYKGVIDYVKSSSFFKNKDDLKTNGKLVDHLSTKFFKLFGSGNSKGEIKSVDFLVNEISKTDIVNFFNDLDPLNLEDKSDLNKLEREYLAAKTVEYNKILSLVDALMAFNSVRREDIFTDLDTTIQDAVIKLQSTDKDGQILEIKINHDEILSKLETEYLDGFMKNLIMRLNSILIRLVPNIKSTTNKEYDPQESYNMLNREIITLRQELEQARNDGDYEKADSLNDEIQNLAMQMNIHQNNYTLNRISNTKSPDTKHLKSELQFDNDLIEADLTSLFRDIQTIIVNNDKFQELIDYIGNRQQFTYDTIKDTQACKYLNYSIDSLADTIVESFAQSLREWGADEVSTLSNKYSSQDEYIDKLQTKLDEIILKIEDDNIGLKEDLVELIHKLLVNHIWKRIGKDFGDATVARTQKYNDLRIETNPIIRKTITNVNLFKTFIVSEEVLVSLYDAMFYTDTQKYLNGLIRIPPSKVRNEQNKIIMILKRLGLDKNQVFIISKNNVIMSTPDFLGLTGSSIFSKIPFYKLETACKIDYSKDLWENKAMFAKVEAYNIKDKIDNHKSQIQNIRKDLAKYKGKLSDSDKKEKRKKENLLREIEAKLRKTEDQRKDSEHWNIQSYGKYPRQQVIRNNQNNQYSQSNQNNQ